MGGDGYSYISELPQRKITVLADKKFCIQTQSLGLVYSIKTLHVIFQNQDAEIIPPDTDLTITDVDTALCQKILSQHTYQKKLRTIYQIFNDALKGS